jgi:hypothetical protein
MKLNKFKNLLFGFIIGCVVGGSIVWWQKAYLIDKLIEKGISFFTFNSNEDDANLLKDSGKNNTKIIKTKYSYSNSKEDTSSAIDTIVANNDINHSQDSTKNDSIEKKYLVENDYSIVKEELLYSKSLKIINKDNKKESINIADTIFIEDNIGDKVASSDYNIEFWKSPINFKGYKTGKNKIILYGIYDFKRLSLKKQNDVLYLQCDDKYYIIENTDDFKPLSLLSNKSTINQLGEK